MRTRRFDKFDVSRERGGGSRSLPNIQFIGVSAAGVSASNFRLGRKNGRLKKCFREKVKIKKNKIYYNAKILVQT